jgi:putative ABC transport system permease protein
VSAVELTADPVELDRLNHALKATPAVAAVNLRDAAIASFKSTLAETLGLLIFFNVLFAGIIAFGVVYNAARVSLSERSRELASLRVLGFTRAEIGAILLGELAVLTLVAVPLGLVMGYGLAALVAMAYDTELYRFPLVVFPRTFAAAAGVVLVAAAVSALAVRRRLNRLDLVAVLKTRE